MPASGRAAAPATNPVPPDSLAHYAPSGTAIFAEIRGLRELEQEWSQSDWGTALSSIIMGRADEPGSGNEALKPLADVLGIDDPIAVRRGVLGRQAAVALPNWADLAHGVLLAIPEQTAPIEEAMAKRNLKPETFGKARQYQLDRRNHCLATDGRVLLLGRRGSDHSAYERALSLLAGQEQYSLAEDASFRENVAALGPGLPRGLLYFAGSTPAPAVDSLTTRPATMPATTQSAATRPAASAPTTRTATAPTSQPFKRVADRWWPASWPTLVRGAVGVTVNGGTIALNIRGQLDQGAPRHLRDADVGALKTLPATTLAAWAQSISFPSHYRSLAQGTPSFLTLYLAYIDARLRASGTSLEEGLLAKLGQETIVILGVVPPADQTVNVGFDIPAFGLIVPVNRPQEVARTLDTVGGAVVDIFNFPGVRGKMKEPLHVEKKVFDGTTIAVTQLGEFFRTQTACPFTHTLALSWAVTDRDVIVSTHADHIRQILRARAGQIPRLDAKLAAAGPLDRAAPGADAVLLAQPAEITAMLDNWMEYLAKNSPEVLEPAWWRLRQQKQAARVSLGFGMAATRPSEVIVHNTLPGWPAHGRLQPGDRILAADGVPLDANNPRASLKQLVVNRKQSSGVTLTIERAGQRIDIPIPLPDEPIPLDPIAALRQIGTLMKPFAAASYTVWCSQPNRFNARVTLRAAPSPSTRTASAPASGPASRPAASAPAPRRPATSPASTHPTTTQVGR